MRSNKFYAFYMAVVVNIDSGRVIGIYTHRGNLLDKSKLVLYKPLLHCNNHFKQLQLSNKAECFSFEGGCD